MYFYMPLMVFSMSLLMGTMICLSSSSWIGIWIGLEINMMSFIPIMSKSKINQRTTEATIKYFIVQAVASNILLMSSVVFMVSMFNSNMGIMNQIIISMAITLKLGAAPLHFWFPSVINNLSWMNISILMTWQKIAPLFILSLIKINMMIFLLSIISAMVGSLGGINQTLFRKILAYSSINHLGWMLSSILMNENTWILYFSIYFILITTATFMFNSFNLTHINQSLNFNMNFIKKYSLFIMLLSLGGLPPMLGFYPKWVILQTVSSMSLMMMTLISTSLITLYFYLRITISVFSLTNSQHIWIIKKKYFNSKNQNLILISLNNLLLMPLILIFILIL